MTRRNFIGGTAALVGAAVAGRAAVAQGASPYRAADYAALRKQLRAFYPPDGQGDEMTPQDPRALESCKRIESDLTAWCAAHPGYDALDVRRECYLAMRKHFLPFLFTESPFYFEAGVNGATDADHLISSDNAIATVVAEANENLPDRAKLLFANDGHDLVLRVRPLVRGLVITIK